MGCTNSWGCKYFFSLGKQRLHDNFIQNWNSRLRESNRASFYSGISSFHFQHYLNFVRTKKYRQAIASLRCSSHRLETEAGRWHKPIRTPVENRKCKRCDVVENEFHFLFECSLYSELRIQYLDCYFYEHSNNFKLRQLFNSAREKQATDLSIFIYKAFT